MIVEVGVPDAVPAESSPAAPFATVTVPFFERTRVLLAAFLAIAAVLLVFTMLTVNHRQPQELPARSTSARSHLVLSHWLNDGYFHYAGMLNRTPGETSIYRSSTGGYMVSGFIVEKLYSMAFGHYSYRLLALHNQVISAIVSALAGLLSYRLARRFDLEPLFAFTAGAAVVAVVFTFPDNLDLYWEMTPQAYALLFALVYLLIEERSIDRLSHPRRLLFAQAAAVFLMTVMEGMVALGFVASVAATVALLRRDRTWKRFLLVVALPCLAALVLQQLQLRTARALLPEASVTGSNMLWRTGLDGDTFYYGDHLDIAKGRGPARANWALNREYLFRWPWVFILGVVSTMAVLIAYIRGRTPRIALEALIALTGSWLLYGAIFSQAFVIHPYLYDVLLFTPLCVALFAIAPSLLESLTRRTGAILLVVVFSAFWYSFFQLRLYALRAPLPKPAATSPAK